MRIVKGSNITNWNNANNNIAKAKDIEAARPTLKHDTAIKNGQKQSTSHPVPTRNSNTDLRDSTDSIILFNKQISYYS